MTCPSCKGDNEMAFSALIRGFVCSEPECGLELEMEYRDAEEILAAQQQVSIYAS
jgi:hypothetical protein